MPKGWVFEKIAPNSFDIWDTLGGIAEGAAGDSKDICVVPFVGVLSCRLVQRKFRPARPLEASSHTSSDPPKILLKKTTSKTRHVTEIPTRKEQ
eukprot:1722601-Amphidinium_carterae.1